jgi:hypothetical protein
MIAGRLATTTPAPGAKGSRPDRSVPLGSARRPARPSAKGAAKVEFVPKSPEGRLAVATLFRSLVHPGRLGLLGFIASGERSGASAWHTSAWPKGGPRPTWRALSSAGSCRSDGPGAASTTRSPTVVSSICWRSDR